MKKILCIVSVIIGIIEWIGVFMFSMAYEKAIKEKLNSYGCETPEELFRKIAEKKRNET